MVIKGYLLLITMSAATSYAEVVASLMARP
jgi:hypothetical protein